MRQRRDPLYSLALLASARSLPAAPTSTRLRCARSRALTGARPCPRQIHLFDVDGQASPMELCKAKYCDGHDVLALALSQSGFTLAVAGNTPIVSVFTVKIADGAYSLEESARLKCSGASQSLAMNADASLLVSGGQERVVEVWGASSIAPVDGSRSPHYHAKPHTRFSCKTAIHSLSLSSSGHELAVGTSEHTELYELELIDAVRSPPQTHTHTPPSAAPFAHAARSRSRPGGDRTSQARECAEHKSFLRWIGEERSEREAPDGCERKWPSCPAIDTRPLTGAATKLCAAVSEAQKVAGKKTLGLAAKEEGAKSEPSASTHNSTSSALGVGAVIARQLKAGASTLANPLGHRAPRRTSARECSETGAPHLHHAAALFGARLRMAAEKPLDVPVKIWSCTPLHYFDLPAHQGGVCLSRDGHYLAVASDQLITVCSVQTGGTMRKVYRSARVRCVALSAHANILVAGGFDKKTSLLKIDDGARMHSFHSGHAGLVRAVHVSSDSSRLALGGQASGGSKLGLVELYDALSNALLARFEHEKEVWTVQLNSNGHLLAAAGYDEKLTLYHTVHCRKLQARRCPPGRPCFAPERAFGVAPCPHPSPPRPLSPPSTRRTCSHPPFLVWQVIPFRTPTTKGPAFIWTCDFSADDNWLAVGCWSGRANLYKVQQAKARWHLGAVVSAGLADRLSDGVAEPEPVGEQFLTEVSSAVRSDRVYSISLWVNGRRMVVGGRDKKLAMYDTTDGCAAHEGESRPAEEPPAPKLMWEFQSDDFVYTATLCSDLRYCVLGGVSKAVTVLEGRTGRQLFTVPSSGTVWSLAVLEQSNKLVVGGESPMLTVFDIESREEWLKLPVSETVYSLCVSKDSLTFTDGAQATMFGKGGTQYAWRDQPSTRVLMDLIGALLTEEDKLYHCLQLIVRRHPAIVNAFTPDGRGSVLQHMVEACNFPAVLNLLLSAECSVGLQPDPLGNTALNTALELGKWRTLRQLIGSITERKLKLVPTAMTQMSTCFSAMALRYPREFLLFVKHMPMQPEPEVLGSASTDDVMLPSWLVLGSHSRCPRDLWKEKLDLFKQSRGDAFSFDDATRAKAREGAAEELQEGYSKSTQGGLEALRVPFDNFAGYVAAHSAGASGTQMVAPLQLIVDAVVRTNDFSVFGSKPVQILVEFKWNVRTARPFELCQHQALASSAPTALRPRTADPPTPPPPPTPPRTPCSAEAPPAATPPAGVRAKRLLPQQHLLLLPRRHDRHLQPAGRGAAGPQIRRDRRRRRVRHAVVAAARLGLDLAALRHEASRGGDPDALGQLARRLLLRV